MPQTRDEMDDFLGADGDVSGVGVPMPQTQPVVTTRQTPVHTPAHAPNARAELTEGLCARQAYVSPKYLYDELGSLLFAAITRLPEYYPTNTESDIMHRHAADIAHCAGHVATIIDLGAADCIKGEALFGTLQPTQYVPVDISVQYLQQAVDRLRLAYPQIHIVPVGQDFSRELSLPDDVLDTGRLFYYPGSSISNFSPSRALNLLSRIRHLANSGGGILIGVDRPKPQHVLQLAYDDPLEVTAAFNRNLLRHVNRLIGSDFDVTQWRHDVRYVTHPTRVEMHLVAQEDVTVTWPGGMRQFRATESIHTESSYKYTPDDFAGLLREAGFGNAHHWTDENGWFSVFYATT